MSAKEILKYFIKHVLGYCAVLGVTIIWLYAFILMFKSPTSYIAIGEPNKLIWTVEVIMFVAIIIWSLKRVIDGIGKA